MFENRKIGNRDVSRKKDDSDVDKYFSDFVNIILDHDKRSTENNKRLTDSIGTLNRRLDDLEIHMDADRLTNRKRFDQLLKNDSKLMTMMLKMQKQILEFFGNSGGEYSESGF
jgi:hypothetical protein